MIKLNEDLRRWFKEKWTAQDGSKCGEYKGRGRVKCRPSRRVSEKSPQTWSEMSPEQKKKAVRLKQKAHRSGKQWSSHKTGKTWDGKNNKYKPGKKKLRDHMEQFRSLIIEKYIKSRKDAECGCNSDLIEEKEKKPYKGFKKGKNHPEGGLSRAEARRQGIHAGIETKREAQKKGGFGKLSGKTQKRRKSFCARMCGMKRRRTSAKTARDPKSKINAALRVWGCKCGANESYEPTTPILEGTNKPTDSALWSKAKALARKKFKVYPSAYANGWAAKWYKKHGGGWKTAKNESTDPTFDRIERMNIVEEIVNWNHAGSMTDKEISARDRLAKTLKNVKPIKGNDSAKNAKFRYATFLILKKRQNEKKSKGKKKK